MAGFGFGSFVKPRPVSVGASDVPKLGDLSMQEKLLMLGAALQGDTQGAMSVPMLAAARRRQAEETAFRSRFAEQMRGVPMKRERALPNAEGEDISAAFAPQMETVRGKPATLRDMVPMLAEAYEKGYDVKAPLELLDKTTPEYKIERGVAYDPRDRSTIPDYIPDLNKGEEPVYDARGRIVGVRNMDGSIQAAADRETAVTSAKSRAEAAYDLVEVPMSDGSTVKLPRLQAIERMSGGGSGVPMVGAAPPAPGAGVGAAAFGKSQTPADKERDVGRAKTEVEIEALTPKARSTLQTLDRKTDFVIEKMREARQKVSGGLGGSAGVNALAAIVPETDAFDLRTVLDTIEAAVGFDELSQMRENSPTGGAVGNLTERELSLLSSLRGSFKQGMSPEQLRSNLDRAITELETIRKERKSAFERQYGAGRQPAGAPAGRITPEAARAELARRRAARGAQ